MEEQLDHVQKFSKDHLGASGFIGLYELHQGIYVAKERINAEEYGTPKGVLINVKKILHQESPEFKKAVVDHQLVDTSYDAV